MRDGCWGQRAQTLPRWQILNDKGRIYAYVGAAAALSFNSSRVALRSSKEVGGSSARAIHPKPLLYLCLCEAVNHVAGCLCFSNPKENLDFRPHVYCFTLTYCLQKVTSHRGPERRF